MDSQTLCVFLYMKPNVLSLPGERASARYEPEILQTKVSFSRTNRRVSVGNDSSACNSYGRRTYVYYGCVSIGHTRPPVGHDRNGSRKNQNVLVCRPPLGRHVRLPSSGEGVL